LKGAFIKGCLIALTGLALAPATGQAASGVEHLHFAAGPYRITPGANAILLQTNKVPKPNQDGYMIRAAPNLHLAKANGKCCGGIPRVDVLHLHHGVWLSDGRTGSGDGNAYGGFYPFMATGEEKTVFQMPPGYGYPVAASDHWFFNYMIHNLTPKPFTVYVTYDLDFVPLNSPLAAHITPVHPIWMDVEKGSIYPVFDVKRFSGRNGKFTFPDMANNPYGSGPPKNEYVVQHSGRLVGTAGHLHPGGLYDDLDLIRPGASSSGGTPSGAEPNSVRLFRSSAHYWDPRGPISWDMAMGATSANWRPEIRAGDTLRISTTYETKRASWYESMGIMVVWEAYDDQTGVDPFTHKIDESQHLTHGHLAETNHHGGSVWVGATLARMPDCSRRQVVIAGFTYLPGDFRARGANHCIPTVRQGQSITFTNEDASPDAQFNPLNPDSAYVNSIFHTITSCQNPCGLDTGISYPLANGTGNYDSAQLGIGTPASGSLKWSTPANLRPGTYTYFCRIHPFMRGVFRIVR
jgi:plastocyanin